MSEIFKQEKRTIKGVPTRQGGNSKVTQFKPHFKSLRNWEKTYNAYRKMSRTRLAHMRKSRIAADPQVNFFITETASYADIRSQLSDLFHNTYILIQWSCFSTYHIKNHAGTQWSALSLACRAPLLLCFTTQALWIPSFPPTHAPIFKTNHE